MMFTMDDMKVQFAATVQGMVAPLTEAVRISVEKGFELVAGVAGAKMAKALKNALKDSDIGNGGAAAVTALREQIKDNAIVLIPLMDARAGMTPIDDAEKYLHVITTGVLSTGGMRAMLVDNSPSFKPRVVLWSYKHSTITSALKDLLDVTQAHLKLHLNAMMNCPSPVLDGGEFTSFTAPTTSEPTTGATDDAIAAAAAAKNKLFWDANMVTNPSFEQAGGFDYGSFDNGSTSDSDDATYVEAATIVTEKCA